MWYHTHLPYYIGFVDVNLEYYDFYQENSLLSTQVKTIYKEFLAIRRAISLNETFVLFC